MHKIMVTVFLAVSFLTQLEAGNKDRLEIRPVFAAEHYKTHKSRKRISGTLTVTPIFRGKKSDVHKSDAGAVRYRPHFSMASK